jgi:hypothetical protein
LIINSPNVDTEGWLKALDAWKSTRKSQKTAGSQFPGLYKMCLSQRGGLGIVPAGVVVRVVT